MGPRSVIFGGAGFLGRALSRYLLTKGHRVCVVDRASRCVHEGIPPDQTEFVVADQLNSSLFTKVLKEGDLVFHLWSNSGPSTSNSRMAEDVVDVLAPTIRLCESCVRVGVSKLIFASSGGCVYGKSKAVPWTESDVAE